MPVSRRDLIKRFKALGFSGPYSGGRHQFMSKGKLKTRVPNPHESHDISDSLLREILRQTGITKEQWDKA